MTTTPAARDPRAQALRGLRDLLAALQADPALPVPALITHTVHADRDTSGFEIVARAAHHLGVAVTASPDGTQRAARVFGPVTYAIVYHPAAARLR